LVANVLAGASVTAVVVLLAWPLLFTSSAMGEDWGRHLWLVWQQSLNIGRDGQPSLFISFGHAAFYPIFAFYGGTIYTLTGLLAIVLGHATVTAYVFTYLAAFAAASGGWYWLARMAGLGRWSAQVPGLLFISSAYYLTDLYARGDWPEFLAVSSIPLLLASALHVLRVQRLTLLPATALAGSTLVLFGSHNITMFWGCSVLAAVGVAVVCFVEQARRLASRRGLARVAGVMVPAALVNAWYLLPALAYGRRTHIVQTWGYAHTLRETDYLVAARHLFALSRPSLAGPGFDTALPVLAIALCAVALVVSLGFASEGAWRRLLWIFCACALALGILMTHPGAVLALPAPYAFIQFGYRLQTWVLLSLSAATLATLVLAKGWPRPWAWLSWAVIPVLVASGVGAVQQLDHYQRSKVARAPIASEFAGLYKNEDDGAAFVDYDDTSLPLVSTPTGREVDFPAGAVGEASVAVDVAPGTRLRTNLIGAPYLVSVTGASVVGRDAEGRMVLRVGDSAGAIAHRITLRPADSEAVVLGRLISVCALLYLAGALILLSHRRLFRRTRAPMRVSADAGELP
jgi:hypothetical protein